MKIGYARVSSTDQNLERQVSELHKSGVEKIFEEKVSGEKKTNRKQLLEALDFVREKDTFIVESLDRLGRSYDDIIEVIRLLDEKEVTLVVINLPILNQEMSDTTLQKLIRNMVIQILSWASQNEREEIKRKQQQGIRIAQKKGHYRGRPVKYSAKAKNPQDRNTYEAIVHRLNNDEPIKKISDQVGVSRDTIYRIKNEIVL